MNPIVLFILYFCQPGALKLNESPHVTKNGNFFFTNVAKTMAVALAGIK